jgi:hypothetical protein
MIDQGLLSGLPKGVRALLASPPLTDPRLLELAVRWEGLSPAQARMADALRLFAKYRKLRLDLLSYRFLREE